MTTLEIFIVRGLICCCFGNAGGGFYTVTSPLFTVASVIAVRKIQAFKKQHKTKQQNVKAFSHTFIFFFASYQLLLSYST